MGVPLKVTCHFSIVAFNILSLPLIFVSLITVCLGAFLLGFILPGTLCTSWTWLTISFSMLRKLSAIISSNIFSRINAILQWLQFSKFWISLLFSGFLYVPSPTTITNFFSILINDQTRFYKCTHFFNLIEFLVLAKYKVNFQLGHKQDVFIWS